ncbi:MAG: hypothetical protein ACE5F1_11720 [Planctomycetota bacterium]
MASDTPLWRRLVNGWMAVSGRFGSVQTLMLLVIFYALLIGPAWIVTAVGRRDLLSKRGLRAHASAWQDADTAGGDLERAKLLS